MREDKAAAAGFKGSNHHLAVNYWVLTSAPKCDTSAAFSPAQRRYPARRRRLRSGIARGAFSTATMAMRQDLRDRDEMPHIGVLCLMLQGWSSGSGGIVSPPQGDNRASSDNHAGWLYCPRCQRPHTMMKS
jgi:hypothetical protein